MANGKKTYEIVINGIQESVNAVESLNKQLDNLEARIEKLASKSIKVNVDANLDKVSASQDNSGEIKQEVQAQRELNESTKETIRLRAEEFNNIKTGKDSMREFLKIAKELAAQKAIDLGQNDLSTMEGMKQQLKDIKTVMQTLNVESDKFKEYQQQANELNTKLKDIEAGYGQFGRNVGNYAEGVAEGMSKIQIKVGETTREFDNAREASRTLNMELKNMALNGQQGTKEYNDLNEAVKQMNSTLKDVEVSSVAMDNLLDTMQGIVAVASTAKGLGSLFGLDEGAIEQTIQKLVALQNVLQGIEVIRKQMQTQEGIGLLLSKGNKAVDSLVASIFGLGTASKGATLAVKALSTALKGIGIGLVVAAVSTLITKISDWISKQEEAKKKAEELRQEENKLNASLQVQRVQLQNTLSSLESFNGSKKEEERIVKDLNSKYGQALGTYKTIAQWKDVLKEKTDAYIESLKLEAQMQSLLKQLEDAYIKQREAQNYQVGFWEGLFEGAGAVRTRVKAQADQTVKELEDAVTDMAKKIEENNKKHQINLYSPQSTNETKKKIKDDSKKIEEAVRQAENNINDLRLKLMRDGFYKELMQLDENNRKEIEKIKKNGQKVEEQLKLQQQNYVKQQQELRDKYIKSLQDSNAKLAIDTEIESIQRLREEWEHLYLVVNRPTSTKDAPLFGLQLESVGQVLKNYKKYKELYDIRNNAFSQNNWEAYFEALKKQYLPKAAKEVQEEFFRLLGETRPDSFEGWLEGDALITKKPNKEAFNYLRKQFEEETKELKYFLTKYSGNIDFGEKGLTQTLQNSYLERASLLNERYKNELEVINNFINEKKELELEAINNEETQQKEAIDKELAAAKEGYEKLLAQSKKYSVYTPESVSEYLRGRDKVQLENGGERDLTEEEKNLKALITLIDEKEKERTQIVQKYINQRKKIEFEARKEQQANNEKYFERELESIEEYLQKANDILDKQPEKNGLGFIDIKKTKAQYKEVLDLYETLVQNINSDMYEALTAVGSGKITGEEFERIVNNLEYYKKKIKEENNEILEAQKGLGIELYKQIDFWIQQVGQAATQIIQSIGEINQAAFEKQLEAIEKQTEALEDQLDKQKELTQKYKDDVDSIEDELATARGDRRQHLIDQLNAQMQAQRESLAQEKRMEKEREKLDKKREKLEYDNEMRKWNQSKLTAAINAALAISAAAVNSWPIPAVPMMALATAVGAAQMAAIIANKPRKYADGGLLEGRSHAQGGIKVLGGHAEVEGGEFVTNRRTTAQNSDLLYYINSKKKKLDLSDMIEFYSSKPKKSISGMKRMFADGGELPTLRTDISLNSRLVDTMEKYAERPTVVEVVEIMNKTEDVRRTQVLAGLS